jgi:CheY-like chemotaxis protein
MDRSKPFRLVGSAPPIIVTTSSHETVTQERAQPNGCAGFLSKPVDGYTMTTASASITNPQYGRR